MDPNATLAKLRELTASVLDDGVDATADEAAIAEHFEALDQWIARGGFLPAAWVTVPATAYDIETRMPVHAETLAASSRKVTDEEIAAALAPIGWDPHAAFVENELGGA